MTEEFYITILVYFSSMMRFWSILIFSNGPKSHSKREVDQNGIIQNFEVT